MPKDKEDKKKKLEDSESSSDSDSGPEDRAPPPPAKKPKSDPAPAKGKGGKGDDEPSWELEKKRFVKVREFKGQVYVDIREFYDDGGDLKPGKKGISLTVRQWDKLKAIISEVDEAVKKF